MKIRDEVKKVNQQHVRSGKQGLFVQFEAAGSNSFVNINLFERPDWGVLREGLVQNLKRNKAAGGVISKVVVEGTCLGGLHYTEQGLGVLSENWGLDDTSDDIKKSSEDEDFDVAA